MVLVNSYRKSLVTYYMKVTYTTTHDKPKLLFQQTIIICLLQLYDYLPS